MVDFNSTNLMTEHYAKESKLFATTLQSSKHPNSTILLMFAKFSTSNSSKVYFCVQYFVMLCFNSQVDLLMFTIWKCLKHLLVLVIQ
jgi:hypothetical protein